MEKCGKNMRKCWEVITAVITVVVIVLVCVLGWQVWKTLESNKQILILIQVYSKDTAEVNSKDTTKDIATAQLQLQKDYYDSRIKILELIFTFLGIITTLLVVFLGFQLQSIRKESNELFKEQEEKFEKYKQKSDELFDKSKKEFKEYDNTVKGYEGRLKFLSARVLADSAYSDNDYKAALDLYDKVIAQEEHLKNDPQLYTLVHRRAGWCAYCLGDKDEAIKYHKEGLKILRTDGQTLCSLGYIYLEYNDLENAEKYLKKAKPYGNAPYLYANYAQLYLRKGEKVLKDDDQKAVEHYEKAIDNLVDHYNDDGKDQRYKDYLDEWREDFDKFTVNIMKETIERNNPLDANTQKVYNSVQKLGEKQDPREGLDQLGYAYRLWNQTFRNYPHYKFAYEGEHVPYNTISIREPNIDDLKCDD